MGSSTAPAKDSCFWATAFCASFLVELLSLWLCTHCIYALATLPKYMNAIGNYERGKLLKILYCLATIGAMVGILACAVSIVCWRTNKAFRMRYVIYSYVFWGSTMIVVYIIAAVYILISSDVKETFSVRNSTVYYGLDIA